MQSMEKASEVEVDKTSASTSKAGPRKQSVELPDPNTHPNPRTSDHSDAQPMETDFCGPSLPPLFGQSVQSDHGSKHSDLHSKHSDPQSKHTRNNLKGCVLLESRNTQTKRNTRFGQNTFHSLHHQKRISPLSLLKSLLSPKGLLSKTKNNIIQTQFFTGR